MQTEADQQRQERIERLMARARARMSLVQSIIDDVQAARTRRASSLKRGARPAYRPAQSAA